MLSLGDTRYFKNTNRLKVKSWKNICHVNSNHKKAGVGMLISDKSDIKTKMLLYIERIFHNYEDRSVV